MTVRPEILFFDVETTGLSRTVDRIVQIAWLVTDHQGSILKTGNLIAKPDGYTIPAKAADVHGITTAHAARRGIPIKDILARFVADASAVDIIVGHNIAFDIGILMADLTRAGIALDLSAKVQICTMRSSIGWCRLPKTNGVPGFKWPRLQELHYRLFGEDFAHAHDALADIQATKRCFFELIKLGVIVLPSAKSDRVVPSITKPPTRSSGPMSMYPIECGATARAPGIPPYRLTVHAESPYFDAEELRRGIIVQFNGTVIQDVVEYSNGWVRVSDSQEACAPYTQYAGKVEVWYSAYGKSSFVPMPSAPVPSRTEENHPDDPKANATCLGPLASDDRVTHLGRELSSQAKSIQKDASEDDEVNEDLRAALLEFLTSNIDDSAGWARFIASMTPEELINAISQWHLEQGGTFADEEADNEEDEPAVRQEAASDPTTPANALLKLANDEDEEVRCAAAGNPNAPAEALLRLADDEDRYVKWAVAGNLNTPTEALLKLAHDKYKDVRLNMMWNPNTPAEALVKLANDKDEEIRGGVAGHPNTPPEVLLKLADDDDKEIRKELAWNPSTPDKVLLRLAADEDKGVRGMVVRNPKIPADALRILARRYPASVATHPNTPTDVRWALARNPGTSAKILLTLLGDKDKDVRRAAYENPSTPAEAVRILAKLKTRMPTVPETVLDRYEAATDTE